ncbi:hypothetical protein CEXT_315251 [Caerostris extrusa]|uniref:Uncharacterized protein n=1 Tax=Caerostris extrusa TaxID=172846 RepID=A0AAV4M9B6_CAEEX|nr:hypothetical protein CEXT_315251 [Caerostris extrusa]
MKEKYVRPNRLLNIYWLFDLPPGRVVFSTILRRGAISALNSKSAQQTGPGRTVQYHTKQAELVTNGWALHLQWVRVMGEFLVIPDQPEFPLTLKTA